MVFSGRGRMSVKGVMVLCMCERLAICTIVSVRREDNVYVYSWCAVLCARVAACRCCLYCCLKTMDDDTRARLRPPNAHDGFSATERCGVDVPQQF